MFQIVLGPVLFVAGLFIIFAAVHGLPAGFLRPRPRLPRPAMPRRTAAGRLAPGDTLVADMLSEMLHLREQLSDLQDQVGAISTRPRRQTRAAS